MEAPPTYLCKPHPHLGNECIRKCPLNRHTSQPLTHYHCKPHESDGCDRSPPQSMPGVEHEVESWLKQAELQSSPACRAHIYKLTYLVHVHTEISFFSARSVEMLYCRYCMCNTLQHYTSYQVSSPPFPPTLPFLFSLLPSSPYFLPYSPSLLLLFHYFYLLIPPPLPLPHSICLPSSYPSPPSPSHPLLPPTNPREGPNCCPEAKLATDHLCIKETKAIITDGTPTAVHEDLHAALGDPFSKVPTILSNGQPDGILRERSWCCRAKVRG